MKGFPATVLAIATLLASGLMACGDTETKVVKYPEVPACSTAYPGGACETGNTCFQGVCTATSALCSPTNATGACPSGFTCWGGGCIVGDAIPEACSATVSNGACPSGESCFFGACVQTASICSATNPDGVCPAGWACYGGGCILESAVPPGDEVVEVDCTEHPFTTQPILGFHTAMTRATGSVTLAGVAAGNTLTLGGVVFTAVTSGPNATSFLIGASDSATATNLAAAITAHETTTLLVTAVAEGAVVRLSAVKDGATGNAVALVGTAGTITPSAGTLTGGAGSGKTAITVGGLQFKDANGNGTLETYEDWRLHPICRAKDLVGRMTFQQKHGLLMESGGIAGPTTDGTIPAATANNVVNYHVRQGLVRSGNFTVTPVQAATYFNNLQEMAEAQPLGVPVALTEDPTHSPNTKFWTPFPGTLGLGAIGDVEPTWQYGDVTRHEFRAVGYHWQLGPMTDVATEPRWRRNSGTFGENALAVASHARACITGFQGSENGDLRTGIAATMKHFPGHGPEVDGFDAHGAEGKYVIYPGDNFEYHLIPIKAAIDVNVAAVMPFYAITKGRLDLNPLQVPAAFAEPLITDLLKKELGFKGMVTGDWGTMGSRAWGMETLTIPERIALWYAAGSHQFGSEGSMLPGVAVVGGFIEAYENGWITDAQIDNAAAKVLEMTFKLGLFENPYTDAAAAGDVVRSVEHRTLGFEAMKKAIVILKGVDTRTPANNWLPITGEAKFDLNGDGHVSVYYDGTVDALVGNDYMDDVLGGYDYTAPAGGGMLAITQATGLNDADIAIIRISSASGSEAGTNQIKLSYDYGTSARNLVINALRVRDGFVDSTGATVAPTNPTLKLVLVVTLNSPSILKPWVNGLVSLNETPGTAGSYPSVGPANIRTANLKGVDALIAEWGSTDRALLDLVFNMNPLTGWKYGAARLPFEVPESDEAVAAQLEDVPADSYYPTYTIGSGLTYP